jgi:hypothetical protein
MYGAYEAHFMKNWAAGPSRAQTTVNEILRLAKAWLKITTIISDLCIAVTNLTIMEMEKHKKHIGKQNKPKPKLEYESNIQKKSKDLPSIQCFCCKELRHYLSDPK